MLRSCSSLISFYRLFLLVCTGQPVLIAGDLNADPAVIPCLAKAISAGRFVDVALAYSRGELVLVGILSWDVPMRLLLHCLQGH